MINLIATAITATTRIVQNRNNYLSVYLATKEKKKEKEVSNKKKEEKKKLL